MFASVHQTASSFFSYVANPTNLDNMVDTACGTSSQHVRTMVEWNSTCKRAETAHWNNLFWHLCLRTVHSNSKTYRDFHNAPTFFLKDGCFITDESDESLCVWIVYQINCNKTNVQYINYLLLYALCVRRSYAPK